MRNIYAYKIWFDTKHFIHKDTTDELNVIWTTDIKEAKCFHKWNEAYDFFYDLLGFHINSSLPDSLKILG
jgi:hypothetical protein